MHPFNLSLHPRYTCGTCDVIGVRLWRGVEKAVGLLRCRGCLIGIYRYPTMDALFNGALLGVLMPNQIGYIPAIPYTLPPTNKFGDPMFAFDLPLDREARQYVFEGFDPDLRKRWLALPVSLN